MRFFKNKKKIGLLADVIRCDESAYLIWKWHPKGTEEGEHKREYAIRWGSSLRVKDGEVAIFVYRQENGEMHDCLVGPYDGTLKTANLPVLSGLLGALYGGDTPFQAEVFFINLAGVIQVKFAVPFFDVCDYRYMDFAVPVAVRGTISFKIDNYINFIKLHRLDTFDLNDFKEQIKDSVSRYVRNTIATALENYKIPVVQIESKTTVINDEIEKLVSERLQKDFGVIVSGVDIGAIEIDKTSSGYRDLLAITKDVTKTVIQGQAEANVENYAETLRIQREESQYATHKQTQSANIGAYQIEAQTTIGVAGAEALGKMGENNTGSVELNGNTGFNPAAMMASMTLGGAIGQNMASTMNIAMNKNSGVETPPPIPVERYHVAKDGKEIGVFEIAKLIELVSIGELTADNLVWKPGMNAWKKMGLVEELKGLFPPTIE